MARRPSRRRWLQLISTFGLNLYLPAFLQGTIVQWRSKGICVPVLNCYSCPSAIAACPIGSLQHVFAAMRFHISAGQYHLGLYALGSLGVVASLVGRFPCAWICPFGLLQEALYRIPSPKLRIPPYLGYMRYVFLAVMVFALPFLVLDAAGLGETWFCKWICPAGTLEAGLPLVAANAGIREQVGPLFAWKVAVLLFFLLAMIGTLRPFCRTTCPLGALLGLFNQASLFRLSVSRNRCQQCGRCQEICPVSVPVREKPNSPDCIRCLKCIPACEQRCINYEFPLLVGQRRAQVASPDDSSASALPE